LVDEKIRDLHSSSSCRGKDYCRGCGNFSLFSALDLGSLPIANELLSIPQVNAPLYPLHLKVCNSCGLGQVADVVAPERLFSNYRYLSSMSSTFLEHAERFVKDYIRRENFSKSDWVLEIACNDGYLLKHFKSHQINVLGVEPAKNVADIARSLGIPVISSFFGSNLAKELLSEHGYPKLIVANNVMAHVPDIIDFVKGLRILCGPRTSISIENPSLTSILTGYQFDTVYHEHFSYLSASSVRSISESHDLSLFKIDELAIHGGSNRYWLRQSELNKFVDDSVQKVIEFEEKIGLIEDRSWQRYYSQVQTIIKDFKDWLQLEHGEERRIFGYGAAAKASTLLNAVGAASKNVIAIADSSLEKQDRFMPSQLIPIISPGELFKSNPTDVVIFPWNIQSEIAQFLRKNLKPEVNLWCAIPKLRVI